LSIKQIVEIVKSIVPNNEIEMKSGKLTDRRDYRINCQLIKNVLGWKAEYSVEDGVRELVERFESEDYDWDAPIHRNDQFNYR